MHGNKGRHRAEKKWPLLGFLSSEPYVNVTMTGTCYAGGLIPVTKATGIIRSSDWGYKDDMDCTWNLTSNTWVEFSFMHFDIIPGDCLFVYHGDSTSSPQIGRYSGHFQPKDIQSSSTKLFLRFKTDSSGTTIGFRATYLGIFSVLYFFNFLW